MADRPLMQKARQAPPPEGEDRTQFEPKDPKQFVPPELHDAVDRVVAAGMKLMYSPDMADERQAALQSQDPMPKRLADNITGLMLSLDQHSKGGMPEAVIFPAAVLLVNEGAEMLAQAGNTITQQDYNEALQILYVQLGKKLNKSDDELMSAAENALGKKGTEPDGDEPEGGPSDTDEDPGAVGGAGPMTAATPGSTTPPAGVAMAGPPV